LLSKQEILINKLATLPYKKLREMEQAKKKEVFKNRDDFGKLHDDLNRLREMNEAHRQLNGELRVELKDKGVSMEKHQRCCAWINMGATLGICSGVWITLAYLVFGS